MTEPLLSADIDKLFASGARVRARVEVPSGAPVTILFGASGSGKTTVLRVVAGLERLTAGRVVFRNTVWTDKQTLAQGIADMHVNRWVLMGMINVFLLVCGFFIPPAAIILTSAAEAAAWRDAITVPTRYAPSSYARQRKV